VNAARAVSVAFGVRLGVGDSVFVANVTRVLVCEGVSVAVGVMLGVRVGVRVQAVCVKPTAAVCVKPAADCLDNLVCATQIRRMGPDGTFCVAVALWRGLLSADHRLR
jgi:hypothetical protein